MATPGTIVAGGAVLSGVLNGLFDRVEFTIKQAEAAGERTIVRTGIELRNSIDYAKDSYRQLLNETIDKIDTSIGNKIAQIETLVKDFEDHSHQNLENLSKRIQVTANSLPFADKRPQVAGIRPFYISPLSDKVNVFVGGNFFKNPGDNRLPSLTIKGVNCSLKQETTAELQFEINPSAIFPGLEQAKGISEADGEIQCPWINAQGGSSWANFRVAIRVLPRSLGSITLYKTSTKTDEIAGNTLTQHYHLCSESNCAANLNDCGHNDDHTRNWTIKADADCWITAHGVGAGPDRISHGDVQGPSCTVDEKTQVVYSATTRHKTVGTSGRIDGHIWATQKKKIEVSETTKEKFSLDLNQEKQFIHKEGPWKIDFDDFTGAHHEISGPASVKFLQVIFDGGGWRLIPKVPDTL